MADFHVVAPITGIGGHPSSLALIQGQNSASAFRHISVGILPGARLGVRRVQSALENERLPLSELHVVHAVTRFESSCVPPA